MERGQFNNQEIHTDLHNGNFQTQTRYLVNSTPTNITAAATDSRWQWERFRLRSTFPNRCVQSAWTFVFPKDPSWYQWSFWSGGLSQPRGNRCDHLMGLTWQKTLTFSWSLIHLYININCLVKCCMMRWKLVGLTKHPDFHLWQLTPLLLWDHGGASLYPHCIYTSAHWASQTARYCKWQLILN